MAGMSRFRQGLQRGSRTGAEGRGHMGGAPVARGLPRLTRRAALGIGRGRQGSTGFHRAAARNLCNFKPVGRRRSFYGFRWFRAVCWCFLGSHLIAANVFSGNAFCPLTPTRGDGRTCRVALASPRRGVDRANRAKPLSMRVARLLRNRARDPTAQSPTNPHVS